MKPRHHKRRHVRRHYNRDYSTRKKEFNREGCAFCHNSFEGLPHRCKFCGKLHCSKHLLPESHDCSGLKNIPRDFGDHARHNINANHKREDFRDYHNRYNTENQHISHTNSFNRPYRKRFRVKMPKLNRFIISLILAIATFFLAFYVHYTLLVVLEAIAWIYFSYNLYIGLFKWANRVNMGNDLAFFGLRILAGIIVLVGIYVGFVLMLSSVLVRNSASVVVPLFILLLGLIIFAGFIVFRTDRRHQVIGVWRA